MLRPVHTARSQALAPVSRASEARPGTQGDTTARFNCPSILPLGPGSRIFALAPRSLVRDTRAMARAIRTSRTQCCFAHLPVSRCQTAQCWSFPRRICAPGFSLFLSHPTRRGVGGAPTGAHILLSRLRDATDSARVRRGASHDAGRSPLGAPPWRFSAGGRASISGIASGSVQRAPRSQVVMPGGRCPGPPEPAVTSRGRRTPLPAPPSGSSPETPLHERGWQKVLYIRYVVK